MLQITVRISELMHLRRKRQASLATQLGLVCSSGVSQLAFSLFRLASETPTHGTADHIRHLSFIGGGDSEGRGEGSPSTSLLDSAETNRTAHDIPASRKTLRSDVEQRCC